MSETAIEAPQPVVLRTLSESGNYAAWSPFIHEVKNISATSRQTTYWIGEHKFVLPEKIVMDYEENCVCFEAADSMNGGYISIAKQAYTLRSLPDGSSEIRYQVTYHAHSLLTRVLNYLFMKRKAAQMMQDNLQALKEYIQG